MKRFWVFLAAGMLLLTLTGCSGLSYEELYCLPKATEEYYDLQDALNAVLEDGYSYLSPTSGVRQEPVQLTDLDGDGEDEAVAFFRSANDGSVKVYVFFKSGEAYTPAAVIEGAGSSVAQVEYADLDGEGHLELIVTYQVSEAVNQALQVYRYADGEAASLLTAGCTQYLLTDLDGDGLEEILCLTGSGSDTNALVECYDTQGGELLRIGEYRLRFSYDSMRNIQEGSLTEDTRAVLISGVSAEGQLQTDVITAMDGQLLSVSPEEDILTSSAVQSYYVYPDDVDGDGILEIAQARQLTAYDSDSAAQWVIDWYQMDADGACEKKTVTYRSFSDDWYLTLPEAWDGQITIRTDSPSASVSEVCFCRLTEDEPQEILTIYTLRGSNRQSYAEENELTILVSDSDIILAVALADGEVWEGTVSIAQVSELFHYVRSSGDGETA